MAHDDDPKTAKKDDAEGGGQAGPEEAASEALSDTDLSKVSGGFAPQPEPPKVHDLGLPGHGPITREH